MHSLAACTGNYTLHDAWDAPILPLTVGQHAAQMIIAQQEQNAPYAMAHVLLMNAAPSQGPYNSVLGVSGLTVALAVWWISCSAVTQAPSEKTTFRKPLVL